MVILNNVNRGRKKEREENRDLKTFIYALSDKERRNGEIWYLVFAPALLTIVNIKNHESLRN